MKSVRFNIHIVNLLEFKRLFMGTKS